MVPRFLESLNVGPSNLFPKEKNMEEDQVKEDNEEFRLGM